MHSCTRKKWMDQRQAEAALRGAHLCVLQGFVVLSRVPSWAYPPAPAAAAEQVSSVSPSASTEGEDRSPTHASRFAFACLNGLCGWGTGVGVEVERMLRPLRLCAFLCRGRGPPHDAAAGHVSRACGNPAASGPTWQRRGPGSPVSFLGPWSRGLCCRCFFRPPSRGRVRPKHLMWYWQVGHTRPRPHLSVVAHEECLVRPTWGPLPTRTAQSNGYLSPLPCSSCDQTKRNEVIRFSVACRSACIVWCVLSSENEYPPSQRYAEEMRPRGHAYQDSSCPKILPIKL
jgi:hypothetical protein